MKKKVTNETLLGAYFLDDIANLEILPYGLHFQKSCHLLKLLEMLMGNIYIIGCNRVMVPLPEC